jgi:hypothetical protein
MTWKCYPEIKPKNGQKVLAYWPKRIINQCEYASFQSIVTYWNDGEFYYPGEEGYAQPSHWDVCEEDPCVLAPSNTKNQSTADCDKHGFRSHVRSCPYCKDELDQSNLDKSLELLKRLYLVIEKPHWKEGETEAEVTDAINAHLSNVFGSNWRQN